MPYQRKEPTRQEIHWVSESRQIELPTEPLRVWTWIPTEKPELPVVPQHMRNAFLEDRVHDWQYRRGILRYYSRVRDHSVWILCEFE